MGIIAGVFCSALLLTGCGKSAKDEFIQGIGNQNAQESGVWDFSMSISDMKFSQEDGAQTNPMIGMLITQIKDASLSGKIQVDAKRKSIQLRDEIKSDGNGCTDFIGWIVR